MNEKEMITEIELMLQKINDKSLIHHIYKIVLYIYNRK